MIDFYALGKNNEEFINELNFAFDNSTYKGNKPKNLENLIMSMYMQIFAYNFDDRRPSTLKYSDIDEITRKVWIPSNTNKSNPEVGIIYLPDQEIPVFNAKTKNEQTEYILEQIRNSVVHGDIIINNDGTVTVFNNKNNGTFKMTFEFECITDICEIISKNSSFKDVSPELLKLLSAIKNIDKNMKEHNSIRFNNISQPFHDLKYPILLFHLLPINEDDIHNNKMYIDSLLELMPLREEYKKGKLDDTRDHFYAKDFY